MEEEESTPRYVKIIFLMNLVVTFLVIAVFSYTAFIYKRPSPDTDEELKKMIKMVKEDSKFKTYRLERFTINLPTNDFYNMHYLDIEVYLIPTKNRYIKLFDEHKNLIIDRIIEVAGQFSSDELQSITGKLLFEERVKRSVHQAVNIPVIKQIYFTRFIVK